MWYAPEYLMLQLAAIAVSLFLAGSAWRWPIAARVGFLALFAWACWANLRTAGARPQAYLDYGPLALLDVYRSFIDGFFSEHIRAIVRSIAACQGLIALGLLVGGWPARVALVGATVFLLAIVPLGVGSGFPSPLLLALGTALLLRQRATLDPPLWRWHRPPGEPQHPDAGIPLQA